MKLYEITIKPLSGFGTPLKGDTLFGHFCWQAAYDAQILTGGLDKWIACYGEKPCVIFSSAWPKLSDKGKCFYALKRPDMPLEHLFPPHDGDRKKIMMKRKENAERKWMLIPEDLRIKRSPDIFKNDRELIEIAGKALTPVAKRTMRDGETKKLLQDFSQPHNSINRLTDTTGEGMFAPYEQTADFYYPETALAVFVLIDEDATDIRRVESAMERIGRFGYGKDSSTGCGRYALAETQERQIPSCGDANACYTLAPSLPETGLYKDYYFTPFTRFGRHGDIMARSANPFKNPVIMADEGAVLVPDDISTFEKPYLGRPALNVSKSMPNAVAQGYAPWLPFKLEI